MNGGRLAICGSCLILALSSPALADGVVRDSVGAMSSGRGGANIAHYDNGAVLLNNPAGIVNVDGTGLFEVGIDGLITDLDYSDPENSRNAHFRVFGLPQFSYIRKSSDERWAAGLGLYIPAGFGARWGMQAPAPIPGNRGYQSFGALVKILPGAAYQVTDRLSVGATLGLAISHAELEGPFFLQTGPLRGAPALLDLLGTDETVTWSVGLQYVLSEKTVIGVVYSSEDRFRLDGTTRATVFLPPAPLTSNFDSEVDLVWPRSAGVGISHLLTDCQRVSLDVLWYDWSHAFDQIDLKLSHASHPAFQAFGPRITDRFPLDWKDSVSVRFGYEYFSTCCDVWRAGYIFNSKNVPNATLTPYIPATLEHTFTVGYGKQWGARRFDIAYHFAFGPEQNVSTSRVVGGDFDNSEVKAQAHWLFLSFQQQF